MIDKRIYIPISFFPYYSEPVYSVILDEPVPVILVA